MKLTIEKKNEIRARLQEYAGRYPSQNKAAASLAGISAATFSALINGKYELISDEMFRRIDAQIGLQRNDEWVLCDTTLFRELSLTMRDAQDYANVAWAISPAGSGKTTTARAYAAANGNVFMVSCSEDMRRGDFIRELARVIGINVSDMSLRAALERVTQYLLTLDRPLLVFDEGDKLPDSVFYYFITIYNRLEGRCGMVFISTHYIRRRMDIGLSYNKKGYDEIHSRICRKFVELTPANEYEIAAVARANGLSDDKAVRAVVKDAAACAFDMRRAKREIHKQRRLAALRS